MKGGALTQAAGVELHRQSVLADALRDVLIADGVIAPGSNPSPLELIAAARDYVLHAKTPERGRTIEGDRPCLT